MIHKSYKRKYKSRTKMESMAVRDAENIVYNMVIKAHQRDEEVSRKEIEEKLSQEPEYKLSSGSIFNVLKKMRLKHMIVLKKIGKQHYYGLPWLTTPFWLATIFSTIIIAGAAMFLLSYRWYPTMEYYYHGVDNGAYVNHHYLTIGFVIVIVINNIIYAICWNKFGTRILKRRKKLFIKKSIFFKKNRSQK